VTKLLTEKQIHDAAQIIRNGGLVAFRTETVYGLGANALNPTAAQKIFIAKNRPPEKHLVMMFPSLKHALAHFPNDIDATHQKLFKKFRKGLTVILPNGQGVRIPSDPVAKKFLRTCAVPLFVTSANLSDQPSPTTWQEVHVALDDRVDAIIMSKPCKLGKESTIIKIEKDQIKILRQGAISADKLHIYSKCLKKS